MLLLGRERCWRLCSQPCLSSSLQYGFTPKGSSVILYRSRKYHHYQFSVATDWPGGVYCTPTMSGTCRPPTTVGGDAAGSGARLWPAAAQTHPVEQPAVMLQSGHLISVPALFCPNCCASQSRGPWAWSACF